MRVFFVASFMIAVATLTSACSTVDAQAVNGPHGLISYRLSCDKDTSCYEKATRICKGTAYNIEESHYDTREKRFVTLISCE